MRRLGFAIVSCVLLTCTLWAAAALYLDVRVSWLRAPLAVAYVLAVLAVLILVKGCWRKLQPPEVCFHHVSATQGMDLIQQLRGCGGEASPGDTAGANR